MPHARPLAVALAAACWLAAGNARAAGIWLSHGAVTPTTERIGVAVGPSRTTLWTSTRFEASAPATVGIVLPVPHDAAVARSSDAWFEALEIATAPRILPPEGSSGVCPGSAAPASPLIDVAGDFGHQATLAPSDVTLAADAAAVHAWAVEHGFDVTAAADAEIVAAGASAFLLATFDVPQGIATTPTFRIVMPGASPSLPLGWVTADANDVAVVGWIIGQGAWAPTGAAGGNVPSSAIVWNAASGHANYAQALADTLATLGPTGFVAEAASHAALAVDLPFANGAGSIDPVVSTYFERAAAYGDGLSDGAACAATAAAALASNAAVAPSCPRVDVALPTAPACEETAVPGLVDPALLRCGPGADDLAVALSELVPSAAWLNRISMRVAAGRKGQAQALGPTGGDAITPVLIAGRVDPSGCGASGRRGTTGASSGGIPPDVRVGSGTGKGSGSSIDVNVDVSSDGGCDCSGTAETAAADGTGSDASSSGDTETTDANTASSDGCGNDSQSSSSDACGGDTTDTSSSGCSGDSGSGDSCSSDGSSGDSCSGGGSGDSCSSGSGDCSVARSGARRAPRPRLSAMTFGLLAIVAPWRRARRRRR